MGDVAWELGAFIARLVQIASGCTTTLSVVAQSCSIPIPCLPTTTLLALHALDTSVSPPLFFRLVLSSVWVPPSFRYYIVKSSWPHQFIALPSLGLWSLDFAPLTTLRSDVLSAVGAYTLVRAWG